MKLRSILLLSTISVFCPSLTHADVPCIPEGETADVPFANPLGGAGMPTSAELVSAEAMESDPFSPDDGLGSGQIGNATTTIAITNTNGTLVAPNGEAGDGETGGDCMEIYMCWLYRYKMTISNSFAVEFGGFSVGSGTSTEIWVYGHVCSGVTEVCPC